MNESILESIKKDLGISKEYDHFDKDIIDCINSVLMIVSQLGIGPEGGYFIDGYENQWSDLIPDNLNLKAVKSYIYIKVKLIFDPPASSVIVDALKKEADEYEWRLNVMAETITD